MCENNEVNNEMINTIKNVLVRLTAQLLNTETEQC